MTLDDWFQVHKWESSSQLCPNLAEQLLCTGTLSWEDLGALEYFEPSAGPLEAFAAGEAENSVSNHLLSSTNRH